MPSNFATITHRFSRDSQGQKKARISHPKMVNTRLFTALAKPAGVTLHNVSDPSTLKYVRETCPAINISH
ncbi:hypothetical protein LPE01_11210 [Lactiplantibacillus pentosus]|nr:hypothetical protein LPE01_11210 [Lactiplantibacillus pentosus]